ncbi:MAG: CPBP family intramembrane glutamic endopeptidase [Sphingomonas sp.]
MVLDAVALVVALAAYGYFFKGDFGRLSDLAMLQPPGWRRRRYLLWIAKSWLLFAAPALLGLAMIGGLGAIGRMPAAFAAPAVWVGYPAPLGALAEELAMGLAAGSVLGGGWALWRGRRGRRPAMLGDFSALLPQDRGEALLAAGTAVTAGITEELYFRLLIPLLVTRLTGSAWLGFGVATVLFGLAHRYQKWLGVVATGLIGLLFAFFYLQSGALWLAMLVHATIDLNGLVVRPALGGMLRRRPR